MATDAPPQPPYPPDEDPEYASRLAEQGLKDAAAAASMPSTIPKGYSETTFETPDLPVALPFLLHMQVVGQEDPSSATVVGPFRPEDFVTDPDTNITTAHDDSGHPVILRVLRQEASLQGPKLLSVGDNGESIIVQVEELRDNTLFVEDPV